MWAREGNKLADSDVPTELILTAEGASSRSSVRVLNVRLILLEYISNGDNTRLFILHYIGIFL